MKLRASILRICLGPLAFSGCHDADDGSSTASTPGSGATSTTSDAHTAETTESESDSEDTGEMCEVLEPVPGREFCYEAAAAGPECGKCFTQWHVDLCTGVYEILLDDYGPACVVAHEAMERCLWTVCLSHGRLDGEDHPCWALYLMMEEACVYPDTDG